MEQEFKLLKAILDHSGCDKKQVAAGARISLNGWSEWVFATNSCKHEGLHCPRLDMPSGEGYHLCEAKHAEVALVEKLKQIGEESGDVWHVDTVWIYGHYYACEPCASALKSIGVKELRIRES